MHLERLTSILEIVAQKGEATVADICTHSDLPKPSAYRLVQDLVSTGLLDPVAKGRFTIGTRLRLITDTNHSDQLLLETIAPILKRAADEQGVSFFLSRLRGRAVEIIHVETPDTGVSYLHPGLGKRPLHACSCSKAVVAFSPSLLSNLDMEQQLKAYTDYTITDPKIWQTELETIRERGYAECVEEIERGMCSVATPLHTTSPNTHMAIGASGSLRIFTQDFRAELGDTLATLAQDISNRFSWSDQRIAK